MPNWCNNFVEISHEDPAKIRALADAMNRGEFCNEIIPVPEDLKIVAGSVGDPDEQAKLEAQTRANVDKHGYGNWYDFCVNRWGTKWDVGGDSQADVSDDGLSMNASFDSAWAPPVGVYEELVNQGYTVVGYYYESGMAFAGVYDNGSDEYWEISGMSADEVADTLPSELDDMFCISEDIRSYQDEQEEELTEWIRDGVEANDKLKMVQG